MTAAGQRRGGEPVHDRRHHAPDCEPPERPSEVAKLLLSKGAKVDQANAKGTTPLSVSSLNGHQEMARMLEGLKVDQAEEEHKAS